MEKEIIQINESEYNSILRQVVAVIEKKNQERFPDYIRNDKTGDWRLKPTIETATKTLYVYI